MTLGSRGQLHVYVRAYTIDPYTNHVTFKVFSLY